MLHIDLVSGRIARLECDDVWRRGSGNAGA
jgi:hypothetical protein